MNKVTHIISSSGIPVEVVFKDLHVLIEQFCSVVQDFRTSKEGYYSTLKSVASYIAYLEQLKLRMTKEISSARNIV